MSQAVDDKVASLNDWRGERLSRIRQIIKEAVPDVVEEVKWRKASNPLGVPTWSYSGIICTGESYSDKIKLTFPRGSSLADPNGLFNASLTGVRRAIDIGQADELNELGLRQLVREAASRNTAEAGR